ncbi:MAG: sulfatase-like hydrolase/transferase [Acidobacteria bacterium]|nr:sulfatase-like hydrolase/transferase [Acidobacteriota bacterium]
MIASVPAVAEEATRTVKVQSDASSRVDKPTTGMRVSRKDAAIALSLANLCALRILAEGPPYLSASTSLLVKDAYPSAHFAAILITTSILTTCFLLATRMMRERPFPGSRVVGEGILWLGGLIALNSLRRVLVHRFPVLTIANLTMDIPSAYRTVVVTFVLAALVVGGIRYARRIVPALRLLLTVLFPMACINIAVTLAMLAISVTTPKPALESSSAAGTHSHGSRVLVLLVDELDYRLAFDARREGLALPNLDSMKRGAFFAKNAVAVADRTLISVPSILAGKRYQAVRAESGGFELQDSTTGNWNTWGLEKDLLDDVRESGLRTGIVGWYLPYCRTYAGKTERCAWWEASFVGFAREERLLRCLRNQLVSLVEAPAASPFPISLQREMDDRIDRQLIEEATSQLSDANLDLIFVHLPTAHAPHYYDPETGQLGKEELGLAGYWNGLVFTDRTLGTLMERLRSTGLESRTIVVLTSDHSYRLGEKQAGKRDYRVPFLAKFPSDNETLEYLPPFKNTVIRAVARGLLDGTISSPRELAAFLDRAGRAPAARVAIAPPGEAAEP